MFWKKRDELQNLFLAGKVDEVKQFLLDNPAFNVNESLDISIGWRALHYACRGGHHEILSILLAHPAINVNQKDKDGHTPLHFCCFYAHIEVWKILLKDSRVDINWADDYDCTALWWACYSGHEELVKWMVALRGDELDLEKKGRKNSDSGDHTEYTAIEIAGEDHWEGVIALLERFIVNPTQTRHEVRLELGLADTDAAELFALIIFLCDDFLRLKPPSIYVTGADAASNRLFKMAKRLPMELQMMLCCRVFGSTKETILSKDSEPAFKLLAKIFKT
jgi:hypothetical protein